MPKQTFHMISPIRRDPHIHAQFKYVCDAFISEDIPNETILKNISSDLIFLPIYQLRFLDPKIPPVSSRRKSKRELWNTVSWKDAQSYHRKMGCKKFSIERNNKSIILANNVRKRETIILR